MKHHGLVFLLWFTFANISHIQAITFEQWRAENFNAEELANPAVSGEVASPAGDGLSNLLKYAFDLDPHVPSAEGAPQAGFFAGHLALSFFRRYAANDLLYALEASPDLVHWSIRNSLLPSAQVYLGAVAQWTVVDSYVWPDPNKFLRLRVVRGAASPQLFDPPELVQAKPIASPLQVALRWSDRSNTEIGYLIERQRVADGVWDLFAVTGEDTIFYSDHTAQSGTAYNYRIRAMFPSNPAFPGGHFSAWSESGAVTPVSPGGGGGGVPPDPDPDTDNDTFKDSVDAYPHDNRRSRDLPVLSYVAVDVSSAVTALPIQAVALDEQNTVAFAYEDATKLYAAVTRDGATVGTPLEVTKARTITYDIQVPDNSPPYEPNKKKTVTETATGEFAFAAPWYGRSFVNTAGHLTGTILYSAPGGDFRRVFIATTSTPVEIYPSAPSPLPDYFQPGLQDSNFGWASFLGNTDTVAGGYYNMESFVVSGTSAEWFADSYTNIPGATAAYLELAVSSFNGTAAGYRWDYTNYATTNLLWPSQTSLGSLSPQAVNDSGLVLGERPSLLPGQYDVALSTSANKLADTLPAVYRKQIRLPSAYPAWINNQGDLVIGSAQILEGPEDAPVWKERTILWRKATDELFVVLFPFGLSSVKQFNNAGCFTAIAQDKAHLLVPVEISPSLMPVTGVARGKLFLAGASKDTMPIFNGENVPTIKIGEVACASVHQDEIDPRIFYFTPPQSPSEGAGKFDLELSGITVSSYPFLAAGLPLKLRNSVEYTDDAQQGTKGFMDSNLIRLAEAQSFIAKADESGTLSDEEANGILNGYGDSQARDQSSLAKVFFASKAINQEEVNRYERALDRNTASFEAAYPVAAPNEPSYVFPTGVTVQAVTGSVAEGTEAVIRFWRPDATFPAQIAYTLSGTADADADFPVQTGTLTFSGSELSVDLTIPITADAKAETTETLIATVTPGAYAVGFFDKAIVYLSDSAAEAAAVPGQVHNAGQTPPAPSGPSLGTAAFFTEARQLLAASASKVLQGTSAYTNPDGHVGLMHYLVFSADDLKLKTVVSQTVGNTIENIRVNNSNAKIILNGALFNYKDVEPLWTIGRALSGGALMATSTIPEKESYKAAQARYWFGQTFDKSAAKNNGHALSYEFGQGHPPEGGQIDMAMGGLISLIYPNGHAQTPQDDADLDVYEAGWFNKPSGNIGKRVRGAVARLVPFNIIGVDRDTGLMIIVSKPYKQPILLKDAQQALVSSGVDLALITDGGSSVACWAQGWPHNGGYLSREGRHLGSPEAKETVTNYLVFEP